MAHQWPQRFRTLPTPMAGLALGVASVAWCADSAFSLGGWLQVAGAVVAAGLLALLIVRAVFHFDTVLADVRHPVVGSILPTFAMCLMVISNAVGLASVTVGDVLWCVAIALHVSFLVGFGIYRLADPKLNTMVPSWFVPPVGIVVADVSFSGTALLQPVAEVCLVVGLVSYAILLPLMLYRLFFGSTVADAAKPTLAIMAAPASLSLAGYLTVVKEPNFLLCAVLLGIAILMTVVLYFAFWNLLRLRFSPGYAAFTFPMAIGATALYKSAAALKVFPAAESYVQTLTYLAHFELAVAVLVIAYVFILYARNFASFLAR